MIAIIMVIVAIAMTIIVIVIIIELVSRMITLGVIDPLNSSRTEELHTASYT